ncbi:hypothetical protein BC938DRAFT_474304 [Jimgerdemannia flammicorona]|uniref:Uncharacterized protein n=1 Tax=Jimgerdemannia flammicorona TaxID=994334 RepID=A0A433QSM0_9FUNG|nr:hypothetical protein BC938DRAFT_474304 [Jimgerdemannia flammicorona]
MDKADGWDAIDNTYIPFQTEPPRLDTWIKVDLSFPANYIAILGLYDIDCQIVALALSHERELGGEINTELLAIALIARVGDDVPVCVTGRRNALVQRQRQGPVGVHDSRPKQKHRADPVTVECRGCRTLVCGLDCRAHIARRHGHGWVLTLDEWAGSGEEGSGQEGDGEGFDGGANVHGVLDNVVCDVLEY